MARLPGTIPDALRPGALPPRPAAERSALAATATRILVLRRHRDALLGADLGEGAWDVLLDTYAAREGRASSTAELVRAARYPPAVTRRTIAMLEAAGKVSKTAGPGEPDERRLALTPATAAAIETLLEDLRDAFASCDREEDRA